MKIKKSLFLLLVLFCATFAQGNRISAGYHVHLYQVSARIIDVETAEVVALSVIDANIQSGSDMSAAVSNAVTEMLKTVSSNKANKNMPKIAVSADNGIEWENVLIDERNVSSDDFETITVDLPENYANQVIRVRIIFTRVTDTYVWLDDIFL